MSDCNCKIKSDPVPEIIRTYAKINWVTDPVGVGHLRTLLHYIDSISLDRSECRFEAHLKHVQQFLTDVYATVVDPVEDSPGNVRQTCEAILKAATEQRQREYDQEQRIADLTAELEKVKEERNQAVSACSVCLGEDSDKIEQLETENASLRERLKSL